MKLFLVLGTGLCLATGFANADTTEVNSDNASEFSSTISFAHEDRVMLDEAGSSGWYISPNAGINFVPEVDIDNGSYSEIINGSLWQLDYTGASLEFDTGYSCGLGLGKQISNTLAFQVDFSYMENDLDKIGGTVDLEIDGVWQGSAWGDIPITGVELKQMPIMASLIWSSESDLKPYFGAGIGTSRYKWDAGDLGSDSGWAFTFQFLAGFKIEMSPSSDMSIGYRFLRADYDIDSLGVGTDPVVNHSIQLGLNFRF